MSNDLFDSNDSMGYVTGLSGYARNLTSNMSGFNKKSDEVKKYNDKINTILSTTGDAFIQKGIMDSVTVAGRGVKKGVQTGINNLRGIKPSPNSAGTAKDPSAGGPDDVPQTGLTDAPDTADIGSKEALNFITGEGDETAGVASGAGEAGRDAGVQPSAEDDSIFERGYADQPSPSEPRLSQQSQGDYQPPKPDEDMNARAGPGDGSSDPARGGLGDLDDDDLPAPNEAGTVARASNELEGAVGNVADKEAAETAGKDIATKAATQLAEKGATEGGEVIAAGGGPEDPLTDIIALGLGIGSLFAAKKLQKKAPTAPVAGPQQGISTTLAKGI